MLKIVLTGGPSTGKTSVINSVKERFKELGYRVLIVPETATELILAGIKPAGEDSLPGEVFQEITLRKQLNKEALTEYAAKILGDDKTIIIYDRGALDGYAYVDDNTWDNVLTKCNVKRMDLLMHYDAVIYLGGAKEFFTRENNAARYEEDVDFALSLGPKVLKPYLDHPNLRVVQAREELKDKQEEVNNIIANMLGNPTRVREQRKYLLDEVDFNELKKVANRVELTQDYLKSDGDIEYRLREIVQDSDKSYHFSAIKKDNVGRREIIKEEVLDSDKYQQLIMLKNPDLSTIKKQRYSFVYANQYFKLDVFDDKMYLLEVNLTKENNVVTLPNYIKPLDDVTNNPEYDNINIARRKKEYENDRKSNSDRGHRLLREGNAIKNIS